MGVGFELTSTPWKRRLWAKPSVSGLAKEVRRIYGELLRDPMLTGRLAIQTEGQNVYASWHPAGSGLELELLENGQIRAVATTNPVGPGLHAHLIDVLDALAKELSITWDFTEGGDETEYAKTRDYAALQDNMLHWLRSVCRVCLQQASEGASNFGLSMQLGVPRPIYSSLAYSAQGTWRREDFEAVAEGGGVLRDLGARFFSWWSCDMDAAFWLGIARAVAWCDVHWVTPRDGEERATVDFALTCFDRARQLDRTLEASREFDELRALASGTPRVKSPRPDGIGHRRVTNTFELTGSWTVDVGGHFVRRVLNEGKNLQLDDGERAIYVTSFKLDASDDAASALNLVRADKDEAPSDLTWQHDHVHGAAHWQAEGATRHLMAKIAVDGELLLLTITADTDTPRDWFEAIAKSARHPQL
jgi:hypothetical protein